MKCIICGREFQPNNAVQKTCSVECRLKRKYQLETINRKRHAQGGKQGTSPAAIKTYECKNCGKTFTPSYKGEKFCSDKCRLQFFHLEEWL